MVLFLWGNFKTAELTALGIMSSPMDPTTTAICKQTKLMESMESMFQKIWSTKENSRLICSKVKANRKGIIINLKALITPARKSRER